MKHNKTAISKQIGWTQRTLDIPAMQCVELEEFAALSGCFTSARKILEWYRFCKSPVNDSECEVLNRIVAAVKEVFE